MSGHEKMSETSNEDITIQNDTERKRDKKSRKKMSRKKKLFIIVAVIVLLILCIPGKYYYKDGGSICYRSLWYAVTDYNATWGVDELGNGRYVGIHVEIFGKEVYSNNRVVHYIQKSQADAIQENFKIEVPEKTNVIYYESSLSKIMMGHMYVELEFSKKDYKNIIQQIEENHIEESIKDSDILMDEEKYNVTKKDVDKMYKYMGAIRRDVDTEKIGQLPMTFYYNVYVTEVKDGYFYVVLEAVQC